MEQDDVQLMRTFAEAYTAAWCSQDAASVASFYEENGSLSVNEDAPAVGREAITEVAQGFMTAFPDLQVFLDDLLLQDDGAIYHWTPDRDQYRAGWDWPRGAYQRLRSLGNWQGRSHR
jgi:ketosteroid isomerase-like protein